jgi:hypothetical protein
MDQYLAMYHGWTMKVIPVHVIHHRPTSSSTNKGLRSAAAYGLRHYEEGNSLLLAFVRSLVIAVRRKPYVLSGLVFFSAFLTALLHRAPRTVSPELGAFIRRFQYSRLFKQNY